MKLRYDKNNAYKVKNFIEMSQYIDKIVNNEIPLEMILIDGVYVLVHLAPVYYLTQGPIAKIVTDNNNMGYDAFMTLYPDYFKLPDINMRIFFLAYCIGRYKTSNLKMPQFGIEKMKREGLKVGKTIEEDLRADRYASKVLPNKIKSVMLHIAQYIEDNMQWDEGALDMRLRAYQQVA